MTRLHTAKGGGMRPAGQPARDRPESEGNL